MCTICSSTVEVTVPEACSALAEDGAADAAAIVAARSIINITIQV